MEKQPKQIKSYPCVVLFAIIVPVIRLFVDTMIRCSNCTDCIFLMFLFHKTPFEMAKYVRID